jgi:hypothetical protein
MQSQKRSSRLLYLVKAAVALAVFSGMIGYALVSLGAAPSALETASNGPMKQYYKSDADRDAVVSWIKSGTDKARYDAVVAPILENSCVVCHSPKGSVPKVDLTTYDSVKKYATISAKGGEGEDEDEGEAEGDD